MKIKFPGTVTHWTYFYLSYIIAAVQDIVLPGPRLVRNGTFATVSAKVQMLTRDLLAIENNDKVVVALGGPYNGTFGQDK